MNVPNGLILVGRLAGTEQKRNKAGELLPFHELQLEIDHPSGATGKRSAEFFAFDNETGEPTRIAQQLGAVEVGSRVAVVVKVSARVLDGGRVWTSLHAARIVELVPEGVALHVVPGDDVDEDDAPDLVGQLASGEMPGRPRRTRAGR